MIAFYLIIVLASIFLVNKYCVKNPIVLHQVLIALYCFYNPFTNKAIFILIAIWIIYLLTFQNKFKFNNKYTLIILTIGTYWLFSGMRGILVSRTMDQDDIASFLVSPYVNGVLWAVLIVTTIKSIEDVTKFFYCYAFFRLVEIGISGIVFYFFFYDTLMQYSILLKEFIRLDVDPAKRLISIASRNANDAAFLLMPSCILYFQNLYFRTTLKYGIYFLISVLALILTFTRSGWLIFIICIVFFILILKKIKISFLKSVLFLFVTLVISLFVYFSLLKVESRLTSDETIVMRMNQYYDYFFGIGKVGFFNGIYEDIWTTADFLSVREYISSENIFLDTFIKHGVLAGILYSIIWLYFIITNLKTVLLLQKNTAFIQKNMLYFIASFCSMFFVLFLMANTSLFEQSSFYWILFALSVPIYNYVKKINKNNVIND